MKPIKCKLCSKLLAKIETFSALEIKCPRCKTLNLYSSTVSTVSTLPDCQEQPNLGKNDVKLN